MKNIVGVVILLNLLKAQAQSENLDSLRLDGLRSCETRSCVCRSLDKKLRNTRDYGVHEFIAEVESVNKLAATFAKKSKNVESISLANRNFSARCSNALIRIQKSDGLYQVETFQSAFPRNRIAKFFTRYSLDRSTRTKTQMPFSWRPLEQVVHIPRSAVPEIKNSQDIDSPEGQYYAEFRESFANKNLKTTTILSQSKEIAIWVNLNGKGKSFAKALSHFQTTKKIPILDFLDSESNWTDQDLATQKENILTQLNECQVEKAIQKLETGARDVTLFHLSLSDSGDIQFCADPYLSSINGGHGRLRGGEQSIDTILLWGQPQWPDYKEISGPIGEIIGKGVGAFAKAAAGALAE